ncbi:zinc-binding dehydrogenase [Altererythrobacter marinus]|uniref:Zinc-binding dehydrogenase n=1 Tax=Pelagerythrobacter marinus TaxID=538382 RepID=A0ABW9UT97_9SPHN|nr:zinc-binding dehydrogenase [Pelagerythrobacter marinus]
MACFTTPYGLRYAAHCFNRAHARNNRPALIPAGGKLGVTSQALKANYMLVRSASVHGVYWSFDRAPEAIRTIQQKLVEQCSRGEIRPLIRDLYPMEDLVAAMESLRSRRTVGKVIIATSGPHQRQG